MWKMLKRLRWQLSLLYLLAALGLVLLVGGGAYSLISRYFENTTDLALRYKMATQFNQYGVELPAELAKAEQSWLGNYALVQAPIASRTPTPAASSISSDDDGSDEYVGETGATVEKGDDGSPNHPDTERTHDDSYDPRVATIFVLPLNPNGDLIYNPNPAPPPITLDASAREAALANGVDLRTLKLQDGSRLRLLTYRMSTPGAPAMIQAGRLLDDQDRVLSQLRNGLLLLGGVITLLLGGGSWWLSGRSLGPAQKAWDQQQAFVSNASHELRTPLTLIRATAEYGLRSNPDEQDKRVLKDILQDCDYMNRLVDDLLLLSRLDNQRLPLDRKKISLAELLGETKRQIEKLADEKGVEIQVGEVGGAIWGDPTRMRQVLLILIDNALRFTPAGGAIRLGARVKGKLAQIFVADNGAGIPPEHVPHVFERFYQVRQPGNGDSRSNGLGLSIAKGLVEAQGGSISLESLPGNGTTVLLAFPQGGRN
jgi:signal transduction histidine kinase